MIGSAIDVHDRTGQLRTVAAERSTGDGRDRLETVREQATIEVRGTDGIVPKGESKARTVSSVPVHGPCSRGEERHNTAFGLTKSGTCCELLRRSWAGPKQGISNGQSNRSDRTGPSKSGP